MEVADDGLREVLVDGRGLERRQVHAVEAGRLPEEGLGELLVVERLVREGREDDVPRRGHHEPARLEPAVARHDVRLEHALVHEEEADGLRDDDVHGLRQLHLLHCVGGFGVGGG